MAMIDMTTDEIRALVRTAAYKVAANYPAEDQEWVAQDITARAETWINNMAELSEDEMATIEIGIKSMKARYSAE